MYTNIFTLAGSEPSKNKYLEMLGIWYTFLKRFSGLTLGKEGQGSIDKVYILMDDVTHAYLRSTGEVDDFLKDVSVALYKQPATLAEGAKARYSFAAHLQANLAGPTYLYLDVDVLVCRPLTFLYDSMTSRNRLIYTTEEAVSHISGDITSSSYLAGRLTLTDEQAADLSGQGGISSGIFGWQNSKPAMSEFFVTIVDKMNASTEKYYTLDQPYFNEAIVSERLRNPWNTYHIDSEKIGINADVRPDMPYVLVNMCGEPGNGELHLNKLIDAYGKVFSEKKNNGDEDAVNVVMTSS